jgi:hypothetical protein
MGSVSFAQDRIGDLFGYGFEARLYADAIIADKEDRHIILSCLLTDLDAWLRLIPHVLGGILDQVLQDLH